MYMQDIETAKKKWFASVTETWLQHFLFQNKSSILFYMILNSHFSFSSNELNKNIKLFKIFNLQHQMTTFDATLLRDNLQKIQLDHNRC